MPGATSCACLVPRCFPLTQSRRRQIRQLALVELRKRVSTKKNKQWLSQAQDLRTSFKSRLLDLLLAETKCVSDLFG